MKKLLAVLVAIALSGSLQAQAPAPVAAAAQNKDTASVRKLIKEGADVNAAQGDGMTALHWAAHNGSVELAQVLLYAGANLEAVTRNGAYTPLHLGSKAGHAAVLRVVSADGTSYFDSATIPFTVK